MALHPALREALHTEAPHEALREALREALHKARTKLARSSVYKSPARRLCVRRFWGRKAPHRALLSLSIAIFYARLLALSKTTLDLSHIGGADLARLRPGLISLLRNELESLACRSPIFAPSLTCQPVRSSCEPYGLYAL